MNGRAGVFVYSIARTHLEALHELTVQMDFEKLRRSYIVRLAVAVIFFMVCVGLEVVTGKYCGVDYLLVVLCVNITLSIVHDL